MKKSSTKSNRKALGTFFLVFALFVLFSVSSVYAAEEAMNTDAIIKISK